MFEQIPVAMRKYRQFICWRLEGGGSKIPYNPLTGKLASVSNSATWVSFEEAVASAPAYSGIGFVLTRADPFFCIDLDKTEDRAELERQIKVYQDFDSWTERSFSGKGAHVWGIGEVSSGRRRASVEVYSTGRYIAMTGNIINDQPLKDCQELLTQLWNDLGGGEEKKQIYEGEEPENESDEKIISKASKARNGERFKALLLGQWENEYPSQSEADFAFIDILAFYTQNKTQITRMFRRSALGQRKKAERNDYVNNMIKKSFDQRLAPISDELRNNLNAQMSALTSSDAPAPPPNAFSVPSGLLGDIARFIYDAAPSPVPEIALAGAIGLMAGICGRAYNISGTGLNEYVIMLARTGFGKEAMAAGISKLLTSIRMHVPDCVNFRGPGEIASARALIKYLAESKTKSVVSILSEFGLLFGTMNSKHADSNSLMLRRTILDLFMKSGQSSVFEQTIYSDKQKNVPSIGAPAFSLLCESTPEEYYKTLDEALISQGLLPRFTTIEYYGPRPAFNANHLNVEPSESLKNRLAALCAESLMHNARDQSVIVQLSPAAQILFDEFRAYCFAQMPEPAKDIFDQIWSRAHIKALRLGALIAVGCNEINPVMTADAALWAINLIKADSHNLIMRFENDDIGESVSEFKQLKIIQKAMKDYILKDWSEIEKYKVGNPKLHFAKIIPYKFLNHKIGSMADFRKDRIGSTNAIKRAIETLIKNGDVTLASGAPYGFLGQCFFLVNLP